MKRLAILTLIVISSSYTFSQNQIFIGTKSYEATPSWKFSPAKRTFIDDDINIQVGKISTSGIIMLSVASEFGRASISGIVLIYLSNGTVLSMTKKIASDYANDRISVIYSLNSNDINAMKENDIINVRFNYTDTLGRKMGLTARNGQVYFDGTQEWQTLKIETASGVRKLFSE
jgi:hypothetical protein